MNLNNVQTGRLANLIVQKYERHLPTAFDESLTLLEKVNKIIEYLNSNTHMINQFLEDVENLMMLQNKEITNLDELFRHLKSDLFDNVIPDEILEILENWYQDGKLATIINEQIFNDKVDREELNQFHVNVRSYGAMGDGTNQTEQLQQALDENHSLYFPSGVYEFDKLTIDKSNVNISIASDVIFKSSEDSHDVSSGAIEIAGKGILFSTTLVNNTNEMDNVIYVDSTDGFLVGDFVMIDQVNPTGLTFEDHRQKFISTIARIKAVDPLKQSITFEESLPHAFQTRNQAKAHKVDMIRNVNIIANGTTTFDKMFTETYSNHIVAKYVHDLKISNFDFLNGGGKGVRLERVHTYDVRNCLYRSPTKTNSGQGYGFQAELGSCYGYINNFNSFASRHGIDFARGAHHCLIENCKSFGGGFNGHGQNSKYIHFKDCYAYNCGFGLGNNTFNSDERWTIENCHVFNHDVGFSFSNASHNISVINCSARNTITSVMLQQDAHDIDIINFSTDYCTNGADLRLSRNVNIDGFTVTNFSSKGLMIRMNAENIQLKNMKIFDGHNIGGVEGVQMLGVKHIHFKDCQFKGEMRRAITFNDNTSHVTIDRCDIDVTGPIAIEINNTNDIPSINASIKNAVNISGGTWGIHSVIPGLSIINNNVKGILLQHTDGNYDIMNNHISTQLTVQSDKDLLIIGNFGNANVNVPETNETISINNNRFY